jgi:hypothetical protein
LGIPFFSSSFALLFSSVWQLFNKRSERERVKTEKEKERTKTNRHSQTAKGSLSTVLIQVIRYEIQQCAIVVIVGGVIAARMFRVNDIQ